MADLIKNPNQRCYVYLKNVEILTQRVSLLHEGISKLNLELSSKDEALRELNNNCDQMVWIKMGIVYVQKPRNECMTTLNQGKNVGSFDNLIINSILFCSIRY